jgi:hypothetical protein
VPFKPHFLPVYAVYGFRPVTMRIGGKIRKLNPDSSVSFHSRFLRVLTYSPVAWKSWIAILPLDLSTRAISLIAFALPSSPGILWMAMLATRAIAPQIVRLRTVVGASFHNLLSGLSSLDINLSADWRYPQSQKTWQAGWHINKCQIECQFSCSH